MLRIQLDGFYIQPIQHCGPLVVVREGVVLDSNPDARLRGVSEGFTARNAINIIPNLTLRTWREDDYRERCTKWLDGCLDFCDVIEPEDQHVAYLDLSGHPAPGEIAVRVVESLEKATGLPVRFGAGPSKWVAFLASQHGDWGQAVREPAAFLAPLPVLELLPIAMASRERLRFLGYRKIGDVAKLDIATLRSQFGEEALTILRAAAGSQGDPVEAIYPPDSIADRVFFPSPLESLEAIDANLRLLAQCLGGRLMGKGQEGSSLELSIETETAGWQTRTREFAKPMRAQPAIFAALQALWSETPIEEPVLALGARLRNLRLVVGFQPALVGRARANDRVVRLERTVAQIHTTFGERAVLRASEMPVARRVRVLREWQNVLGWR
ncbi:DNA polymerase Y family protein [Fimbriimonas ginsengisoli]|uniref:Putative DNA polymerase IV n=1 Tax=Fimbriimonas ginsengisoli Gsoil 348 TaxID=661478 RepID=A0A068NLQ4_FIMGI|nr:hypothetical protein [Fimbriimonas ginsengisoli]AIE84347.1 putative DNA polymerase IV [Fimbriimonas ginsengisoli Gsoil 348]